jgi:hypothetical protein
MGDPKDSLNIVSARTYDRNLTDKLYDISNNVSPQQLQNIIDENIKIENENSLGVPSSSSSSFLDLDGFKKEGDEELPIAGCGGDSEDDTDNETTGGESSTEILPEDLTKTVQDNNNNRSISRPKPNFVPKPPSEPNLLRRAIDN